MYDIQVISRLIVFESFLFVVVNVIRGTLISCLAGSLCFSKFYFSDLFCFVFVFVTTKNNNFANFALLKTRVIFLVRTKATYRLQALSISYLSFILCSLWFYNTDLWYPPLV